MPDALTPTCKRISPEAAPSTSPDWIAMDPEFDRAPEPVDREIAPLLPPELVLAVDTAMDPVAPPLPAPPEFSTMLPPLLAAEDPAERTIEPPAEAVAAPTTRLMDSAEATLLAPVCRAMDPDCASAEEPVDMSREPVKPESAAPV